MNRSLKFLLLEDIAADAQLVERELKKAGFNFDAVRVESRDGFQRALEQFKPDLILADYNLPEFGAVAALRLLKERAAEIPLILVTGTTSEEIAVECIKEGAEDYILKSSLTRLAKAVQNTLRKKEAERDRAASEAAFRRSEEQYRLITENTRDLVSLLDLEFRVLYASPSFSKVLGQDPAALIGLPFADLVHPSDVAGLRQTTDEALFFREARNAELRLRHRSSGWLAFECTAGYIFEGSGGPQRLLFVARDSSERKRAEDEIRKLAAFPRYNPNPILEFAADGTLSYFNDAALAMARSLKRNQLEAILPLNTPTIVKMCLSAGQSRQHVVTPIGGRTLTWSFFPVISNRVVHCYAEDITESLNLEAQLRQAQKMDSIGQLAAGVAHDFNNILTVINGHAGLLLSSPELEKAVAESLRQISLAAERATNLTRQLLTFSRKQILQPQLLNLNDIINDMSKMVRSLVGETVTVKRELQENLPAIHADPGMMEQTLVNLAVNARDAMPKGGALAFSTALVEVEDDYVRQRPEARRGFFVRLSVTDTGHGMDADTLSHIFEPFFTTKEIGKGTGLGLATVYGIVKQHQGWIEVESQVGIGTTFKVYLPISARAPRTARPVKGGDIPGGHETILVVEDEPSLRELVQEILQKKGYRVLEASNGVQALQLWDRHKQEIDLLLTDMMMPEGLSGRDLAERALGDRSDLKVIFSTGYSVEIFGPGVTIQEGLNFLQKPYDPETLARTVRACLNS